MDKYDTYQIVAALRYLQLKDAGRRTTDPSKRIELLSQAIDQGCAVARSCSRAGVSSDALLRMMGDQFEANAEYQIQIDPE